MNITLQILGFIWLLPMTIIVWLFYIFPAWALGLISYSHKEDGYLIWNFSLHSIKNNWLHNWYRKMWEKWWGWSGPCVVIVSDYLWSDVCHNKEILNDRIDRIVRLWGHERRHCVQQFAFGVFHYPLYFLSSVFIWLFLKDKHAYLDNPFERDARKTAGQPVDIPRERWLDGKDDRWPWF